MSKNKADYLIWPCEWPPSLVSNRSSVRMLQLLDKLCNYKKMLKKKKREQLFHLYSILVRKHSKGEKKRLQEIFFRGKKKSLANFEKA